MRGFLVLALVGAAVLVATVPDASTADVPMCLGDPATIVGTDGPDVIQVTHDGDVVESLGGNDTITVALGASGGFAEVCAGDGDDTVLVTSGGAAVSGEAGNDRIDGTGSDETVADYAESPEAITADLGAGTETGWGTDTLVAVDGLVGSKLADMLTGDDGDNYIAGYTGADRIAAGGGDDTVSAYSAGSVIDGGAGIDTLTYADQPYGEVAVSLPDGRATVAGGDQQIQGFEDVVGTRYDDYLLGSAGPNMLDGGGGDDKIEGGGGDDFLAGEGGADLLVGGPGDDLLSGDAGNDRLIGGPGADSLSGSSGNDYLAGGAGNDEIDGGPGRDTLDLSSAAGPLTVDLGAGGALGQGSDQIAGIEILKASRFADRITGSSRAEIIYGGAGADTIAAGGGNDQIFGEAGNDRLAGGPGNDVIDGGPGRDRVDGGPGLDTCVRAEQKVRCP